jgi:hypothetical protein
MNDDAELRMSETDAVAALESLFPGGPIGEDIHTELRATGWSAPGNPIAFARCIGDALWDVFSDNHDVIAPDGQIVHLGSWRGSGRAIADFLNQHVVGARFRYADFYMGSFGSDDAGVSPLHVLIFRRLRDRGYDWRYSESLLNERAPDAPPPAIVRAYRDVYGRDPQGWSVSKA